MSARWASGLGPRVHAYPSAMRTVRSWGKNIQRASVVYRIALVMWLVLVPANAQLKPRPVDLVSLTDMSITTLGIEVRTGICEERPAWIDDEGQPKFPGPDTAYGVTRQAILSVPTVEAFADEFPTDFSILAAVRPEQNSVAPLFAIYDTSGEEQLSLQIGYNVTLSIRSSNGNDSALSEIVFPQAVNDGKQVSPHFSVLFDT
ncbi:collagen alpha-2(XI) chain-like [Ornithodoros turicata]|uniref:collagen alpha-2(XI) chain-like n=1 Tax=Ornithodoros turicata TaxID=34597 RepID=UPI003138F834